VKREIVCPTCEPILRQTFSVAVTEHSEEHFKFLKGKAIHSFFCDQCNCIIGIGDICFAVSLWSDFRGIPYWKWEHEYIEDMPKEAAQ